MPDRWKSHRWEPAGFNSAGDPMYQRTNQSFQQRDYSELTKAELQALLEHMALPTSGNKADLIARLQEAE